MVTACDHGSGKSFGFGLSALKKHKELIPLVAIMGVAMAGVAAYVGYMFTKSDVVIDKSKSPPWERINPEKAQKLFSVTQEWKKIPELESLKKEMGDRK